MTLCSIVSVQVYIRLYSSVGVNQLCLNNITLKILNYFIVSTERKETNKNTKHIFKCMQFQTMSRACHRWTNYCCNSYSSIIVEAKHRSKPRCAIFNDWNSCSFCSKPFWFIGLTKLSSVWAMWRNYSKINTLMDKLCSHTMSI